MSNVTKIQNYLVRLGKQFIQHSYIMTPASFAPQILLQPSKILQGAEHKWPAFSKAEVQTQGHSRYIDRCS